MPNYTIQQINQVLNTEAQFLGITSLPNNMSIQTAINALANANPPPGSVNEKLKDIFTRVNNSGGPLQVLLEIKVFI